MAIVRWDDRPIVTIEKAWNYGEVIWNNSSTSQVIKVGDQIEIQVNFRWRSPQGGFVKFRVWIEKRVVQMDDMNVPQIEWVNVLYDEFSEYEFDMSIWNNRSREYLIDIDSSFVIFRVKVSTYVRAPLPTGSNQSSYWLDENDPANQQEFTAFVEYLGDFSLAYLPITILYCPPGQDMYNASTQSIHYGTIVSAHFQEAVGTKGGQTSKTRANVRMVYGRGGGSVEGSAEAAFGESTEHSDMLSNAMTNKITFGYDWTTTLIADNQRVIGRKYWGPLGDLFLILKNPWFSLILDENEQITLSPSELARSKTEILIVPAHKLIRPGDDPIVSDIPEDNRVRILELDPFIVNLHKFFPEDQADPSVPLSEAVDPYRDPSPGYYKNLTGQNRAQFIARYSISNGVELDLSRVERMSISNTITNATDYYAEVREFIENTADINFFIGKGNIGAGVGLGMTENRYTGKFVKVSYHNSVETIVGEVKTALCKLIRNQNQADLDDIEIWWDKQFSTFMFRKVKPGTGLPGSGIIEGTVLSPFFEKLNNIFVEAVNAEIVVNKYPEIFKLIFDALHIDIDDPVPDIDLFVDKIIELDLDLDPLLDQLPPELAHTTMSDEIGHYSIQNLNAGTYLMITGNLKRRVKITEQDIRLSMPKREDLQDVKRLFDPRSSYFWELEEISGAKIGRAKRIQLALSEARDLDKETFTEILSENGIKIEDFEQKAVVRYGEEKIRPGTAVVGGWVTDPFDEGIGNYSVYLINKKEILKADPEFLSNWPDVDTNSLIQSLPQDAYFIVQTDRFGKYNERNMRQGRYVIISGNRKKEVSITLKAINAGTYRRVDLKRVKQIIDPARASFWELRKSFGISILDSKSMEKEMRKMKVIDKDAMVKLLAKNNLSLVELEKKFVIKLGGQRR